MMRSEPEIDRHPDVGFHLELLGKVIAFAQLEGRPGDFARLRRRLDAIRRQVEADDVRLARFSLEHLLGCLELDRWIQVLAAVLLPEVRQRVLDVLVRSTDVPQDVWQPLDVAGSAAASAANSLRKWRQRPPSTGRHRRTGGDLRTPGSSRR